MKTIELTELKSNVFSGEDTFGRKYELAIKDSKFYIRNYGFNGYGIGYDKWRELNEFSGEFYLEEATEFYPERERLKWGWGVDATGYINKRIKLPN